MDITLPSWTKDLFAPARYKVLWGGRGGGKSWCVATALLVIGMERPIRVLCARELQVSIADSVHKLLSDIIAKYPGMGAFYDVQAKAIIGRNGTEFAFKGLKHNVNEIKSFEGVDYCWVEEAQAVSDKSWETLVPTVRKEGSEIWLTFNPKNITDPTWQRFVIRADDDMIVRRINWRDNPFFPDVLEKERKKLLIQDPEAYAHIWEGEMDTRHSGAVYAKFIDHARISPRVVHDPAYPVYTAWDVGYDDATAIWWYQVGAGQVFLLDYYENSQEDIRHYAEVLYGRQIIIDARDEESGDVTGWHFGEDLPQHAHRKAYNYHVHYVPHDAGYKVLAAGGRSIVGQLQRLGLQASVVSVTTQQQSIEALRQTLPKCWVNGDMCRDGLHALMHYHFEYDDDRQIFSRKPVHDHSSHGCNAAEIMARTWRDHAEPVTQKQLDHWRLRASFDAKRREHGLVASDPYRVKPMKNRRDK